MKVLSADFVTSSAAGTPAGIARSAPQIALVGRSNVGKSTLINALCRRKVARTSAAPGKTRLANFYRVTLDGPRRRELYLVDLPGYGYARGDAARELKAIGEGYFSYATDAGLKSRATAAQKVARNSSSASALLLIDSRHPGLDSDVAAYEWLTSLGVEPRIVATKVDKLSRSERARNLKSLEEIFGTAAVPVSAQSGEGLNELWQLITRLAKNR